MAEQKLVLDTLPNRVQHIKDRGEDLFHSLRGTLQQQIQPQVQEPDTNDIDKVVKAIENQLDLSQISSAMDGGKKYLPRDKLRSILTIENVRIIVNLPFFKDFPHKDELVKRIYYGSEDSNPLLKLLTVFIGIEKLEAFPDCIKEGMDDGCLPMEVDNARDGNESLYCKYHETRHTTINNLRRPNSRTQFVQWSYSLIAPHITSTKEKHSHYHLHAGDVFPMPMGKKLQMQEVAEKKQKVTGEDNNPPTKEIRFNYGGFSEVYQVRIEESNQHFDGIGMRHPKGLFALKKLTSHNRDNFNMELSSLLFCMDKSFIKKVDKHVIQPLATFEVDDPVIDGSTYYILFDWAEGNLNDFWKTNDKQRRSRDHCKWMSHQFHSLCLALECVHNERDEALKAVDKDKLEKNVLGRPQDADDLYGRHGDIKPDNLLWFRPSQPSPPSENGLSSKDIGQLALSDFGLGRLHTKVSRSYQDPKNIARTETYRAPEFDLPNGKISRASDIFGLGCVFLEYVTWFLLGSESVTETFPNVRLEQDIYAFESDTFFNIRTDGEGSNPRPFIKESVKKWILRLQNHDDCTWYLHQLLEVIRDKMLAPERKERIQILPLIKEMDVLRQTCERDGSFYLEPKASARSVDIAQGDI
ncbi:kinase-like protein [Daldinia eschscholtzii]|nr:kinase-like protein [Daldinia eschscholtzii]